MVEISTANGAYKGTCNCERRALQGPNGLIAPWIVPIKLNERDCECRQQQSGDSTNNNASSTIHFSKHFVHYSSSKELAVSSSCCSMGELQDPNVRCW